MPQAKQKRTAPVKLSAFDVHVRDCMVWPDPNAKPGDTKQQRSTYVLPKKGEVGRPLVRGFKLDDAHPPRYLDIGDDHVIDALRGWPRSKQVAQEEEQNEAEKEYLLTRATELEKEAKKTRKTKKGNNKKMASLEYSGQDPHIADLIAHRFLSDAVKARQREERNRQDAARAKARREYERRLPTSIKATKASQLRSIAMAERVEHSPFDLWQMPRFKSGALPAVDSNNGTADKRATTAPQRYGALPLSYNLEDPLKYSKDNEPAEEGYPELDLPRRRPMDDEYYHKFAAEDKDMFGYTGRQGDSEEE